MAGRRAGFILAVFLLGTVVGGIAGVFIFIQTLGGSGEASQPISAPTLSLGMLTSTPDGSPVDTVALATEVAEMSQALEQLAAAERAGIHDLSTQVAGVSQQIEQLSTRPSDAVSAVPSVTPTHVAPTPTSIPEATSELTAQGDQRLYRIVPEESEARFILDELEPLRNDLVGSTNQVAGDFIIDFATPANSRIGVIRINMRTFVTDSRDRDRVIRGEVFRSDRPQYEFSDFVPQVVSGLPDNIVLGEPVMFQVTGDFPIRGMTHSFTFDTTVTLNSADEIHGLARTTINRFDYDLLQSFLADHGVSEEIILELEFVARVVER